MTRSLAFVDRLITLIFGLALLALGTFFIAINFGERHALDAQDWMKLDTWPAAYDWEYLPASLLAGGILATLIGLWLIVANLKRRRVARMNSSNNSPLGTITVNVANVADAMAESLEQLPKVNRASAKVVTDRKVKTLELTVTADPTVDVISLKRAIAQQEAAFRSAVRDMNLASSYRIHLGPVERGAL
ncbi:hypothetical protein [Corynebacterium aquilae]|uniref:Alkaline shock response membrane anchor protein AmaP n=1 Tax=Corynebacterium aquilae DSM 44791 TaxID=1431546 RepID=A0A1L7CDT2_9CORY|nr:hypothetical protein [Corynebacterium aquilae]APT83999.1 hypothetical protein CAQU_01715 [Corynebacterium aquilae DSM 44791]